VSKNAASIFVTRFFAGIFGSAPVTIGPAALADIFSPQTRGIATAFFVTCVMGGPILAPIIGAALTVNPHLGWRCKLIE
jgi:MFS family permease